MKIYITGPCIITGIAIYFYCYYYYSLLSFYPLANECVGGYLPILVNHTIFSLPRMFGKIYRKLLTFYLNLSPLCLKKEQCKYKQSKGKHKIWKSTPLFHSTPTLRGTETPFLFKTHLRITKSKCALFLMIAKHPEQVTTGQFFRY